MGETYYYYYPLHSLTLVSTTCFPTCLPTCLQVVSLSSLRYRASVQVSSIWDGEESFSPLSFLSLLVPLVFPSAFFTSLLIHCCCSLRVLLDPGLLILLVSHLCPCLFPLFSPSCILSSLPIAILLSGCFGKNGFPGLCFPSFVQVCVPWDETYYPLHSLTLDLYYMFPYLPSYLSPSGILILSPLPCFCPGLQHLGLFSSSLSFLTCSSSLSQCLLHFSPHYCCSLWVLLGHKVVCKAAPESCPPKLLFFKAIVPQSCSGKFAKDAPETVPRSCFPKLLPKAAPQSTSAKRLPQSGYSPKTFSKSAPESCSVHQNGSPKLFCKAAPESCARKLLPKAALRSCPYFAT